jgi:PTH1 family peptidyl-tRNA hydrolase
MLQAIIALGNPGPEYAKTRHNAGWLLVDAFAEKQGLKWKNEEKFQARVTKAELEGRGVWLVKPQTFMNLSGESAQAFFQFHKFKLEEMLLVHDEVAFDSGSFRLCLGGSAGGHNGVFDVIERLGTQAFWRLRLGTGPRNPLLTLTEWVLGPLSEEEQAWLTSKELIHTLNLIIDKGPAMVQNTQKPS